MIDKAIIKLVAKKNLSPQVARKVFNEIMSGKVDEIQISAFLTALKEKGESPDEIAAAARVMREKMVSRRFRGMVVDTCGTGGSGKNKFNISTASAFVIAGCGLKVAKHGNRSASSRVGSADVLEKIGINLSASAESSFKALETIGIAFFFAPNFHKAMKYAAKARKKLKMRTIFNILGPLCNPAGANVQVLGVYSKDLLLPMAETLKKLGSRAAFIVHSDDGMDEVSVAASTNVIELKNKKIRRFKIKPSDFGIKKASLKSIKGGNIEKNSKILVSVLQGKASPRTDAVCMNSALALIAAKRAGSFKEAFKLAKNSIISGRAFMKLEALRLFYYI